MFSLVTTFISIKAPFLIYLAPNFIFSSMSSICSLFNFKEYLQLGPTFYTNRSKPTITIKSLQNLIQEQPSVLKLIKARHGKIMTKEIIHSKEILFVQVEKVLNQENCKYNQ